MSAAPTTDTIPSHTVKFTAADRATYSDYCAHHEQPETFLSPSLVIQSATRPNNLIIDYGRGRVFTSIDCKQKRAPVVQLHKRQCDLTNVAAKKYKFGRYYELVDKRGNIQLKQDQSQAQAADEDCTAASDEETTNTAAEPESAADVTSPTNPSSSSSSITKSITSSFTSSVYSDPNFLPATNNSALFDRNESQKLSSEEISQLKSSSASADTIVQSLVSNSLTFSSKTEFSQEKYIKKKKQKYLADLLLIQANSKNLVQTYFDKDPSKIGFLRIDTVALILSTANIRGDCTTLICDSAYAGVLTAAAASKVSSSGAIISAFIQTNFSNPKQIPRLEAVQRANLTAKQINNIHYVCVNDLVDHSETKPAESDQVTLSPQIDILLQGQLDSIVLALPHINCSQLLHTLYPLLRTSGKFVIYSQYLQPLTELMHELKTLDSLPGSVNPNSFCALTLVESWFREHQVLPNRTHPHVSMTSNSGYILSGHKSVKQVKPAAATQPMNAPVIAAAAPTQ